MVETLFSVENILGNHKFRTKHPKGAPRRYRQYQDYLKGQRYAGMDIRLWDAGEKPLCVNFVEWGYEIGLFDNGQFSEHGIVSDYILTLASHNFLNGYLSIKQVEFSSFNEKEADEFKTEIEKTLKLSIMNAGANVQNPSYTPKEGKGYGVTTPFYPVGVILAELGLPMDDKTESFEQLPPYLHKIKLPNRKKFMIDLVKRKSPGSWSRANDSFTIRLPSVGSEETALCIADELEEYIISDIGFLKDFTVTRAELTTTDNYAPILTIKRSAVPRFLYELNKL